MAPPTVFWAVTVQTRSRGPVLQVGKLGLEQVAGPPCRLGREAGFEPRATCSQGYRRPQRRKRAVLAACCEEAPPSRGLREHGARSSGCQQAGGLRPRPGENPILPPLDPRPSGESRTISQTLAGTWLKPLRAQLKQIGAGPGAPQKMPRRGQDDANDAVTSHESHQTGDEVLCLAPGAAFSRHRGWGGVSSGA